MKKHQTKTEVIVETKNTGDLKADFQVIMDCPNVIQIKPAPVINFAMWNEEIVTHTFSMVAWSN